MCAECDSPERFDRLLTTSKCSGASAIVKRKIFSFAFVLSLCIATVAMWVRGYSSLDAIYVSYRGQDGVTTGATVQSAKGRFLIAATRTGVWQSPPPPPRPTELRWERESRSSVHLTNTWGTNKLFGFGWGKKESEWQKFVEYFLFVPDWFIATLLLLPSVWFASLPLRGKQPYSCNCCGYSLTGNTSGICPECGAACKAADPAGASPAAGD